MTQEEKLEALMTLVDAPESDESLCQLLLSLAADKILARLYPYDAESLEVPGRYHSLQIEIALYMYQKQGAEGQVSHSENGISRTYASADIPEAMLLEIVPKVGVL